MFQFRAFPSYAYFIQRTIHRYCLCGFPHSDISGSSLICSSPKLFAACHVLHRLLMPRHSPCALISLTYLVHLFKLTSSQNLELCRLNRISYTKLYLPLNFSLKVPLLLLKVRSIRSLPLLPCFSSSLLCSVFKVQFRHKPWWRIAGSNR